MTFTDANFALVAGNGQLSKSKYPGVAGVGYREVFESIGVSDPRRIGVAGWLCTNMAMYAGLREAFPDLPENPDPKTVFLKLRELRNRW